MAALTIDNVKKRYGDHEVLKGINIAIDRGEFLILVGPSGCGKSTLMNSIAGLDTISDGRILIDGNDVTNSAPKDRDIAMVFQSYALYPNMKVRDNIAFGLEMRGVSKQERAQEVERVAKMLQIEHLLDRKPAHLSGGQRQRVAMGRALARKPQIYLFDEPLSNLDAKLRVEMRTEIKKLHKRLGTTIVYVTHDQIEALTLADRIAVMKDGELQQLGAPKEIYDDPANRFVAGFMGSPGMNFIPAQIVESDSGLQVEVSYQGGQPQLLPIPERCQGLANWVGKQVILGVRPEQITEPLPHLVSRLHNRTIACPVQVTEPMGSDTLVMSELNGVEISARVSPECEAKPDSLLDLSFDMSKAVFFDPTTDERIDR